ncbi:MAG: hypothetical protein LBL79_13835 [Prevotella sp.]|jgi:hypothetical protein|nr:hypothetical protein [Prevotella sp.]
MIRNYLFLAVCVVCFSSCSKEDIRNSTSALKFISVSVNVDAETYSDSNEQEENTLLWCTGNDIKWYNATTGELKLDNSPKNPYMPFSKLVVFLDDNKLFSLKYISPLSSNGTHFPCITAEGGLIGQRHLCPYTEDHIPGPDCKTEYYIIEETRYYISKGYPRWDPKDRGEIWDWTFTDEEREKNWKAIEPEWNLFIEQLKKEGRYRE